MSGIKFYIQQDIFLNGHYFKEQAIKGNVKTTIWVKKITNGAGFDSSEEAIEFIKKNLSHMSCRVRQNVDYSDMFWIC